MLNKPEKRNMRKVQTGKQKMELILGLYKNADKSCASKVVMADEIIDQMMEQLKATGCLGTITEIYSNMENYTKLHREI